MNYLPIWLFIAGGVLAFLSFVSKYLFDKVQDHERRVQKMEDLYGDKINSLEKKIDQMQNSIQSLANNLHKEKNMESALSASMLALNKTLDKLQEKL